jgi:hypothetical protein
MWKGPSLPEYSGQLSAHNLRTFAEEATKLNIRPKCVKLDVVLNLNEPGLIVQRSPQSVSIALERSSDWKLIIEGDYPIASNQFVRFNRFYFRWRWFSDGAIGYVLANDAVCKFDRKPPTRRIGI